MQRIFVCKIDRKKVVFIDFLFLIIYVLFSSLICVVSCWLKSNILTLFKYICLKNNIQYYFRVNTNVTAITVSTKRNKFVRVGNPKNRVSIAYRKIRYLFRVHTKKTTLSMHRKMDRILFPSPDVHIYYLSVSQRYVKNSVEKRYILHYVSLTRICERRIFKHM